MNKLLALADRANGPCRGLSCLHDFSSWSCVGRGSYFVRYCFRCGQRQTQGSARAHGGGEG